MESARPDSSGVVMASQLVLYLGEEERRKKTEERERERRGKGQRGEGREEREGKQ